MPILRREIPCAVMAFGLCAAADYAAYRYSFAQTEKILVKYTGFRDGVFVSPDKFAAMRKNYQQASGKVYEDDKNDLME